MVRDEDPCPIASIDGSTCLFYRGHSGRHTFAPPVPPPPPMTAPPRPDFGSPLDRRPAAAAAYVPPERPGLSAFDLDPDPPTEAFEPLPTPPGWPHTAHPRTVDPNTADSRTAMDRLFDGLPSLKAEDAPFVPPSPDGTWNTFDEPVTGTFATTTFPAETFAVTDESVPADVVDVEVVEEMPDLGDGVHAGADGAGDRDSVLDMTDVIEVVDSAGDWSAVHPEPVIAEPEPPVTTGPARFEPADDRSGKRQKHKRKKVDNAYEPSLGDDAPGGATTVVFRDDPDATLMEVRPTSDSVLTTSILQVIASNDDPLRMGVPTTLRRAIVPPAETPELEAGDLKAMTVAVRDAAERLRAEAASDDADDLREALRDVAGTIAAIAARLPE